MKLSFAVTAFDEMSKSHNFGNRIVNCIRAIEDHPDIDEIVVVDDGSSEFDKLHDMLANRDKVVLHHNPTNLGVFGNKLEAKARCSNEWAITCDSDNTMSHEFIDRAVLSIKNAQQDTWLCPTFARPDFDYRALAGVYDANSIRKIASIPIFACAINTGNQTVHIPSFMEVFERFRGQRFDLMLANYFELSAEERANPKWELVYGANDSCLYNMIWMNAGGRLHFVTGLHYEHYRTNGQESNYIRGPREKQDLAKILLDVIKKGGRDG